MRSLLDVNVLLALLDSDHAHHRTAQEWLRREIDQGWASCPITQNGFVRILSQPRYPSAVAPAVAIELLARATASAHHELWPCDVSILDPKVVDRTRIHGSRQVTDSYLMALAISRGGRFVTFDRAVTISSVRGARAEHLVRI